MALERTVKESPMDDGWLLVGALAQKHTLIDFSGGKQPQINCQLNSNVKQNQIRLC